MDRMSEALAEADTVQQNMRKELQSLRHEKEVSSRDFQHHADWINSIERTMVDSIV